MSMKQQIRFFLSWLASVYLLASSSSVQAAEMALADSPLFLGTQIDPNIFFMLDDSGSMDWEVLTADYQFYKNYWTSSGTDSTPVDSGLFYVYHKDGCDDGNRSLAYIFRPSGTDNVYSNCYNYGELEDSPDAAEVDWRIRSSDVNIMYYDPSATYSPWFGFADANFSSARSNPQPGTDGYSIVRNLEGFQFDVWIDDHGYDGAYAEGNSNVEYLPDGNGEVDLYDSRTVYTVNSSSIARRVLTTETNDATFRALPDCNYDDSDDTIPYDDCFGTTSATLATISGSAEDPWGRTLAEAKQNVANWYQYHRRRSFVMKSAVAAVISSNKSFRFGVSVLNENSFSGTNEVFTTVPDELADDDAIEAHNIALLDDLYDFEWESNGTPLQRGLEIAGRYYSDYYSGSVANPIISACQQNYTVLFTDGYWSSGYAPHTAAISDNDGDGFTDTVADVAKYYYDTDLSTLPNDVPTTTLDDNQAQHMVSFTVAFGVEGNLVDLDDDRYPDPELDVDDLWYDTGTASVNTNAEKIDDLWHAAFNSKGYFVSAQSTEGVAAAISEALLEIADRVGSSASVATNTGSLNAGSKLFQARFDSSDWKGQLLAFQINPDGSIEAEPDWEAGSQINDQNYNSGREIITWNPDADVIPGGDPEGQGIPFRFPADYSSADPLAELTSTQVSELLTNGPYAANTVDAGEISSNQDFGEDIVNYFRGDVVNEGVGQDFRLRNSVLGDIVNSDPKFVEAPNGRYPDALEAKSYSDFVTANATRDGVVYVGANDGMLHGFDEDTGSEVIAYVPNAVVKNLDELASVDYIHRYFVDAGPNILDVYMDNTNDPATGTNGAWRTALVGGLNGGGQGIYALDVTDPTAFDEANASSLVLWEFDDSDDSDLGYTYGRPQLAKMANGKWAAIFGNGYNNTEADGNVSGTGQGALFIVDVETGVLLKKIETHAGSATTPNGLATPLLVDSDADYVVDYIYAGDLLGNLWKFDVTDTDPNDWVSSYGTVGSPDPLFTADANQEITSQPQASFHPDNLGGFMIYAGTGKYLEINDNDSIAQTTQAFYGIWDKNEGGTFTTITSGSLLSQSIDDQYVQDFDTDDDDIDDETFTLRDVSDNAIDWDTHKGWVLSLYPTKVEGTANANNFGERQISNAIVRNGRVIFTTLVPSSVECEFGGTSFLMELDFRDGSALEYPAFDLNSDGVYDADDTSASGRASDVGIMPTVSILADGARDIAFGSGASGDIDIIRLSVGSEAYGRQSWRQLE